MIETPDNRIPVVTSFLYSGGRIALVKRSDRVRTYAGKWAGFSGYLEMLTLNQAYDELAEEAGLSAEQVRLTGIGVPLPVDDPDSGMRWLVFPFLFELRPSAEIRTDWEASEMEWFYRSDIQALGTVPGLVDALDRVWPAFGTEELWTALSGVATNIINGATELARRGLKALGIYVTENWDSLDDDTLLRSIRAFGASRPSMGVFPDLAARLLLAIEREGGEFDFDLLLSELLNAINDATTVSVENAQDALKNARRILTLSNSEVVRNAIMAWQHTDCRVVVAESLPGREGINLGEYLSNEDVQVDIIEDNEIAQAARSVDAVLVGCDSITGGNELQNKVGTHVAVMSALEAGVPAYAIAQTFKISPPDWPVFLEVQSLQMTADEEMCDSRVVFDLTPLDAFTTVFTEEGPLSMERLSEIRAELGTVDLLG